MFNNPICMFMANVSSIYEECSKNVLLLVSFKRVGDTLVGHNDNDSDVDLTLIYCYCCLYLHLEWTDESNNNSFSTCGVVYKTTIDGRGQFSVHDLYVIVNCNIS